MYLRVDPTQIPPVVELREPDDFKAFKVVIEVPEHAWIAPDVLTELAGRRGDDDRHCSPAQRAAQRRDVGRFGDEDARTAAQEPGLLALGETSHRAGESVARDQRTAQRRTAEDAARERAGVEVSCEYESQPCCSAFLRPGTVPSGHTSAVRG